MRLRAKDLILRSVPCARLEEWPRVRALCPSFETRAEFIIGPRFAGTRWPAPQDEGTRCDVMRTSHLLHRPDGFGDGGLWRGDGDVLAAHIFLHDRIAIVV